MPWELMPASEEEPWARNKGMDGEAKVALGAARLSGALDAGKGRHHRRLQLEAHIIRRRALPPPLTCSSAVAGR